MTELNSMSDPQLVALYEQGNDKAFDILLSRYQDQVYSYILYIVCNQQTADDYFQETFTRAIMAIRNHRYHATGSIGPWLIRVAHNLILDGKREVAAHPQLVGQEITSQVTDSIQFAEEGLEAQLIQMDNLQALQTLLQYLPEPQQRVIHLHFYENRTFREIAALTGDSINTCLGRMRYALINLRRIINDRQLSLVG